MDVFRIEPDVTGIRLMVGDQAVIASCLTDEEVDFAILKLKAELERMGGLMKERLRKDAAEPPPSHDDA